MKNKGSAPYYWLKTDDFTGWRNVTRSEFIEAERACGFVPRDMHPSSPSCSTTLATSGFCRDGISGALTVDASPPCSAQFKQLKDRTMRSYSIEWFDRYPDFSLSSDPARGTEKIDLTDQEFADFTQIQQSYQAWQERICDALGKDRIDSLRAARMPEE
ncbi:hypothetical protein [Rhodopseudomonas telluris]|uniref:Uncharacterized protein n=1 Tax=Rhodopseudomonas telluris TaxID=644215 RepID=A0ABV6EZN8_9BRAD